MTKNDLRQSLKEQRDSLSYDMREEYSKAIREQLFLSSLYRDCDLIFSYMSFRSEVATSEIIERALTDGKRVYLPRIDGRDMEFYEIHDQKDLVTSSYGIPEPLSNEKERFDHSGISGKLRKLMLLPGLAFDLYGNRIGYGAGYYDRYLSQYDDSCFTKLALAYELQVVDRIEADQYDKKADFILTPERLIKCAR